MKAITSKALFFALLYVCASGIHADYHSQTKATKEGNKVQDELDYIYGPDDERLLSLNEEDCEEWTGDGGCNNECQKHGGNCCVKTEPYCVRHCAHKHGYCVKDDDWCDVVLTKKCKEFPSEKCEPVCAPRKQLVCETIQENKCTYIDEPSCEAAQPKCQKEPHRVCKKSCREECTPHGDKIVVRAYTRGSKKTQSVGVGGNHASVLASAYTHGGSAASAAFASTSTRGCTPKQICEDVCTIENLTKCSEPEPCVPEKRRVCQTIPVEKCRPVVKEVCEEKCAVEKTTRCALQPKKVCKEPVLCGDELCPEGYKCNPFCCPDTKVPVCFPPEKPVNIIRDHKSRN